MSNHYTLKAIAAFTCLAADCEHNCCKNWQARVDPETLDRWQHLSDSPLKDQLLKETTTSTLDGEIITSITIKDDGNCYHLDDQGLCRIQTDLGAENLPGNCNIFPHQHYQSDSTSIHSASMACTEIARLVIENTDTDIFIEGDINDVNLNQLGKGKNTLENYLDKWCRLVMQTPDVPASVKLYYIGKAINDLNAYAENDELDEKIVTEICKNYQHHLRDILTAVDSKKLSVEPVSAGWFWDVIYNFSKKTFTALSGHYDLADPIITLNIPSQKRSEQDFKNLYTQVSTLLAETRPLFADLQPGLNQYLKTLFVNMGFPWNPIGGNFIASYIKSVFHFASTWYLLALVAQAKGSLTPQDLARVIYYVERDYFHDPKVVNTMKKNPALFNVENYLSSLLDLK